MKYIKYTLVVILCVFSFYCSDRLILYVESKSPIMKSIKESSASKESSPVNAVINGNTIIPGKNGKVVNERESYLKMNDFGTFNETFFVYDKIKPEISVYDHLEKVIVGGNDSKSVALISDNEEVITYLNDEGINYSELIYEARDDLLDNEYINGNASLDKFELLNAYLKRRKKNDKICLIGYSNISLCKELKYFLVSPTISVYKSNLAYAKTQIAGGQIIFLTEGLSLSEAKIIINAIRYKDLAIVPLSKFISEE